jgi:cell filamentation protein
MPDRYDASSSPEGQYQPGSYGKVLVNKLNIIDPDEMDNIEFDLLAELEDQLLNEIQLDSQINIKDLCEWHKRWLGSVYEWAGKYRTVNLSKDDFHFAAVNQILRLMNEFDEKYLGVYTPCEGMSKSVLIEALSICHVEFIIIHPFREGNGRLARLFATVMALQANMPPLDFEIMHSNKNGYISAIHAGHAGDYNPMKKIFGEILSYSNG